MRNLIGKASITVITAALMFITTAGTAHASGGNGYRPDFSASHVSRNGHHNRRHRSDRRYRHNRHNRHHRRHRSHSSHRRGAYLAGGVILGSIITRAITRRHDRHDDRRYESYDRSSAPSSGRRLFRDRNGNCYEKQYNDRGDEILLELDPARCSW